MKNWKLGVKIGAGFGCLILIAMALGGIIVVHDHGVETQNDDRRFAHFEPPEKKLKK